MIHPRKLWYQVTIQEIDIKVWLDISNDIGDFDFIVELGITTYNLIDDKIMV